MHAKPERSTRFLLHVSVAHPNTFRLSDNGAQLIPRFRAKREGASEQGSALGGTGPGLVRGAMESIFGVESTAKQAKGVTTSTLVDA